VTKAVFLDRDGVINRSLVFKGKPFAPTNLNDFQILPGVSESLSRLKDGGYFTVVVTNQPDLSTGKQTWESLNEIHAYLNSQCHIDMLKVCGHISEDRCNCRKPNPGMLIEASEELGIDLSESYMIGDRWGDIEAGQRSGCKNTFFIDYGYTEKQPTGNFTLVKSLRECVDIILKTQTNNN